MKLIQVFAASALALGALMAFADADTKDPVAEPPIPVAEQECGTEGNYGDLDIRPDSPKKEEQCHKDLQTAIQMAISAAEHNYMVDPIYAPDYVDCDTSVCHVGECDPYIYKDWNAGPVTNWTIKTTYNAQTGEHCASAWPTQNAFSMMMGCTKCDTYLF